MALTKDEASDLRNLHEEVVRREIDLYRAEQAVKIAKQDLNNYIHKLQYPPAQKIVLEDNTGK